jgi:hypothetical protein
LSGRAAEREQPWTAQCEPTDSGLSVGRNQTILLIETNQHRLRTFKKIYFFLYNCWLLIFYGFRSRLARELQLPGSTANGHSDKLPQL